MTVRAKIISGISLETLQVPIKYQNTTSMPAEDASKNDTLFKVSHLLACQAEYDALMFSLQVSFSHIFLIITSLLSTF